MTLRINFRRVRRSHLSNPYQISVCTLCHCLVLTDDRDEHAQWHEDDVQGRIRAIKTAIMEAGGPL